METLAQAKRIQALQRGPDSRKRGRRFLWLLLLLIPICLWLTSQIALWGLGANQAQDTVLSNMIADYGQWPRQRFNPLNPELIGTIRADQGTLVALPGVNALSTIVPFISFGTGTQIAEAPSATPTAMPTRVPTTAPTPTRTPYFPSRSTSTPTETSTPTSPPIGPTTVPPTVPPSLPVVQFEGAPYSVNENAPSVTITVTLTPSSSQTVSVTYLTSDNTAIAPTDYVATTNVLTFLPGETVQTFDVSIIDNSLDEDDETLYLTLTNSTNASVGTPNPAVVTILDDDPPCTGASGTYNLSDIVALRAVDNNVLEIACGAEIVIYLEGTPITPDGTGDYDLVFYEWQQPATADIHMDWVIVQVRASPTDPWLTVFNWGDGTPDTHTSLWPYDPAWSEADNEPIPMTDPPLRAVPMAPTLITGIAIDIDLLVPPGSYGWVRVFTPLYGENDPSQVDYIDIIP